MRILEEKKLFPTELHGFAISVLKNQNVEDVHGHEFNEIVIVNNGSGFHIYNEKVIFINRGDFFYINSSDVHSYESTNNLSLINILTRTEDRFIFIRNFKRILDLIFNDVTDSENMCYIDDEDLEFINQQVVIINNCNEYDDLYFIKAEGGVLQIMETLSKSKLKKRSENLADERKKIIIRSIKQNFNHDIDWTLLCTSNNIKRRTLFRDIKEITGLSPDRFQQRYRLLKAKELLRTTDKKISEIALICGFKNTTRFSEAYKKEYEIVPSLERIK